jgi:hypothetical protein
MASIPKIIHQIWIGDLYTPPFALMSAWRECARLLGIEYILWNEEEIRKRGMVFKCLPAIHIIPEINGKADIMRWEILLQYGGIFIDADSVCVEPLIMDFFTPRKMVGNGGASGGNWYIGFSAFENETARPGLVATGTMGFTPGHPLVRDVVNWLKNALQVRVDCELLIGSPAWLSVGPGCITRFLDTGNYKSSMVIFPSHYFIPIHYTANTPHYSGHQKVYAHQLWGTGEQEYKKTGGSLSPVLPPELTVPEVAVSVLVVSCDLSRKWIRECLEAIQNQNGHFVIEVVWVDNGSTLNNSSVLREELKWFRDTSRFVAKTRYHKIANRDVHAAALHEGIKLCGNELIVRTEPEYIMLPSRIQKQIAYMEENPQVVCCGGRLVMMDTANRITTPPPVTNTGDSDMWVMEPSTLCYRKWAICGGEDIKVYDDRKLQVTLWENFGEDAIYNSPDVLSVCRT